MGRGLGLAGCGAIGFSPVAASTSAWAFFATGLATIFSPIFWSWAAAPPFPCVDRFDLFAPGTELG